MRAIRVVVAVVLFGATAVRWEPSVKAQAAPLTLDITLNDAVITPGESLVAGITVNNPGGGPLADFYFGILLPDGSTVVSTGPGVGVRVGTIGNLRSLVPVVRGVSLASAFPYSASPFFAYTFGGVEPVGTYRLFFAAFRTGALDDGAIGGGELLALATKDVTVGASSVVVDTSRTVTRTVTSSGGTVQTTAAGGAVLTLTVPPNSVHSPTAISIAPLVAFDNAPTGRLVAGIRAEPSGLFFDPPLTLTITLPPGFQAPAFGVSGLLADNSGQNAQVVGASLSGNLVTIQVPHFSVAAVTLVDDWLYACDRPESTAHATACQQLQPLYNAELARIAAQGGGIGAAFKAAILPIMQTWLQSGILPRMTDAQTPGALDPIAKPLAALSEWVVWVDLYKDVFGVMNDRQNASAGRPLGALIDQAQAEARLTFTAGMNANNVKCLSDKANVLDYAFNPISLLAIWQLGAQGSFAPNPDVQHCVDVRIDAAPPPVLTPQQAAAMPIDIRVRFSDGVELPGIRTSVVITATNASVTPAGGVLPTPISTNVTLVPTGTSSVVTITAGMSGPTSLQYLPIRSRTFEAGQPAPVITFTSTAMFSQVLLTRPSFIGEDLSIVGSSASFVSGTTTNAVLPATTVLSGAVGYTGSGTSTATRTVTSAPGSVTLGFTAQAQTSLALVGNFVGSESIVGRSGDHWCVSLPVRFDLEPGFVRGPTQAVLDNQIVGTVIDLRTSGTVRLPTGTWCFTFQDDIVRGFNGSVFTGATSGSFGYSLTFRPVP